MSEYQYYEFQAIDQPLTHEQQRALRAISTRAQITATSFTNEYQWGNLKADPNKLLWKYFDAFLYIANWGSHWLSFRLPKETVDLAVLEEYVLDNRLDATVRSGHVTIAFTSELEEGHWEDVEWTLGAMVTIRADLLRGDLRSLYLGWLSGLEDALYRGELKEGDFEAPVPPGLNELTGPLQALADFLRVDESLLAAAAEASESLQNDALTGDDIRRWVSALDGDEKDRLLCEVIDGERHIAAILQNRFLKERPQIEGPGNGETSRRLIRDLLARRDQLVEAERERRQRERAEVERQAKVRREGYLREFWATAGETKGRIEKLINAKQPKKYDEAAALLRDLRDASVLLDKADEFGDYVGELHCEHSRKPSFIRRLEAIEPPPKHPGPMW